MKTLLDLTAPQLRRAARIKDKVERLEIQIQKIMGNGADLVFDSRFDHAEPKPRRRMSKAARAKISRAQRRIWKKRNAAKR